MITALVLNTFFLFMPLERPVLTVAQGYVESGHNVRARGKAGEKGAYQVKEEVWGKVPKSWRGQTRQNEEIVNVLLSENHDNLSKAVLRYNGKGKGARKYVAKVRQRALSIHILDIA